MVNDRLKSPSSLKTPRLVRGRGVSKATGHALITAILGRRVPVRQADQGPILHHKVYTFLVGMTIVLTYS
jgi:hypothetical protein